MGCEMNKEIKPEIVDWTAWDHSKNLDESWAAHILIAAMTDGELFDDKEWVKKKNAMKFEIVLTINGKQAPILPFVNRLRNYLDERSKKLLLKW